MSLEFEWDLLKAQEDEQKHGISFHEGATAFADSLSFTISDPDHSVGEPRYLHLGLSSKGRIVVVSHTERGDRIRIISVRQASKREQRHYEQNPI